MASQPDLTAAPNEADNLMEMIGGMGGMVRLLLLCNNFQREWRILSIHSFPIFAHIESRRDFFLLFRME